MEMLVRDRQIVRLLAQFDRLTISQLHSLAFWPSASDTSVKRALKRLEQQGLVKQEAMKLVTSRGGNSRNIYALSKRGARLAGIQERRQRYFFLHSLAVADAFLCVLELHRSGQLAIAHYSVESEAWTEIGGVDLRPDLKLEIDRDGKPRLPCFLEVDLGTEGYRHLKSKLDAYWNAWNAQEGGVFPLTIWIAPDDKRARDIERLVRQGNEEYQRLFQVTTLEGLPSLF